MTSTVAAPPAQEHVACNLCGSTDLAVAYRVPDVLFHPDEWFQVVECRHCGLGFVNPRPPQGSMDYYYPAAFFQEFVTNDAQHQERYAREAAFLATAPQTHGKRRLLDVGCANGAFPRFMERQGWDVQGVEISSNAAQDIQFPIHRCHFSDLGLSGPQFDAITAWAVLEHVHDPMSYFRKAADLLESGGLFVFLVTNFDSVSSRHLYREDVPRHLHFFTHDTVRSYLDKVGLDLEETHSDARIFQMRPVHWLRHHLRRLIGLPPMNWADLPPEHNAWGQERGLSGPQLWLRYALAHPLAALDRLTMPLYERVQMARKTYGITTYVARKR